MKKVLFGVVCAVLVASCTFGQGTFLFFNPTARTRVGSIDGPFAGPDIWAQMLAGPNFDGLAPIDQPARHGDGLVFGGIVTVPDVPPFATAWVQMVAWDGTLWGSSLAGVPQEWLGRTDVVPIRLSDPLQPAGPPIFTQSAIVPVPEPSALALALLSGLVLRALRRQRR